MAVLIEDYAFLSDLSTGVLVSRHGSIDWLCFPRFDSEAVFASLLGTEEHGRWLLAPADADARVVSRRYLKSTLVLETIWEAGSGQIRVIDFMPVGRGLSSLLRRVSGIGGRVRVRQELRIRPRYGAALPWVSRGRENTSAGSEEVLLAMAGPDAWAMRGGRLPEAEGDRHIGEFAVSADEHLDFELTWFPSYRKAPPRLDFDMNLQETADYWAEWGGHCRSEGVHGDSVQRSLLVLRALTNFETGGIIAAPTTSLPEDFGGSRNWDYRYCWLRDAALTLESMLTHGYETEALKWRNWLLRALAGDPEDIQIMYGIAGERDLPEKVLPHLPGYEGASPVRIGNAAVSQYQADVIGEVMVALEKLRLAGGKEDTFSWTLQRTLLEFVEKHYHDKDCGLWEVRGPVRYFTHSRLMMWVAFDCGIRAVRDHGLPGPIEHWVDLRERLRLEILDRGFDRKLNSFTQTYGRSDMDAALLALPQVGFLPYDDERMLGTVAQLEAELLTESGLLLRYQTDTGVDGLAPGENPFLACSFWLVEQYAHSGRRKEAGVLMSKLVGIANDLGLLSEEFDPTTKRMAGNFPQAFSHLALVRAADAVHGVDKLSLAATSPSHAK
ncbi:glycoside hydrolase family 15 protein [Pseudarthrobacter oxydans]|uniref:glycoside hydrolase family 15 protein n=1 Tax=Pseudarthrobacter oxydans TaxID=1671 RepID=UPI003D2E1F6C